MEKNRQKQRFIFMVSDNTGKTCERVVNAALNQFKTTKVVKKLFTTIRTKEQIKEVINEAVKVNGIIVYTMVLPDCRYEISELGRFNGIPTIDIMGPLLIRFSDLLEISPLAQPGLGKQLDDNYFKRIESIDYTIKHDDGLGLSTLDQAEIILIGVSRTTKTPVSIYLSYRGWKVANIPVFPDRGLPEELNYVDPKRVVALTLKPVRLSLIRMERQRHLGNVQLGDYIDPDRIKCELTDSLRLYRNANYSILDVTNKSIEETSTELMRIIYKNTNIKKRNIADIADYKM